MAESFFSIRALGASLGPRVRLAGELELAAGDRAALVGPSGSGKSLFLRAIAQLDPPGEGRCELDGRDWQALSAPAWRARVSYLPPEPRFWGGCLRDDFKRVALLGEHRGKRPAWEEATGLLGHLGIADLLEADPLTLSSGEKQRAALARLLWLEPRVLLLDEPTAALDGPLRERAEALLGQWVLGGTSPRALFWITHDTAQARRCCNRHLRLRAGRVCEAAPEALP